MKVFRIVGTNKKYQIEKDGSNKNECEHKTNEGKEKLEEWKADKSSR